MARVACARELFAQSFVVDQTARRAIAPPSSAAPSAIPVMFFGLAAADRLFAGSDRTTKQALDEADGAAFRPWPLAAKVDVQFTSSRKEGSSPNVIGVVKGSDPALASEAVVFSAHYDGVGLLREKIYNGAADNAVGVAEMLAVAEGFARAKVRPRRSLVFIAFTAEESGLLGSKYYAAHPTWDLAKTSEIDSMTVDGRSPQPASRASPGRRTP